MYKVTLSMPIYNVAPYVERALLSALNQTFESIEFLLVDDRGTDNSMEIVHRIVEEHPRGKDVRIIEHEHNIGTGATKNTAIANACGEYLFFMDSDDEITLDCIEVLYKAMMEDPVDFVAASYEIVDQNKKIQESIIYKDTLLKGDLSLAEYVYKDKNKFSGTTWNKLYHLDFLKNNNIYCFPSHINEDMIFTAQVIYCMQSCHLIPFVSLYYYLTPGSTCDRKMKSWDYKNANESIDIYTFYFSLIQKYQNTIVERYYREWFFIIGYYNLFPLLKSDILTNEDKKKYLNKFARMVNAYWKYLLYKDLSIKNLWRGLIWKLPFPLQKIYVKVYGFLLKEISVR